VSAENDEPNDEIRLEVKGDELLAQSRDRPPDLVGTRPEWDPETLKPTAVPRAAAGRLWAPAGEGEEGDAEAVPADAAEGAGAGATATATAAPADADAPPRYSRYSARFQFLLGALIAIGAAAVVLLVAIAVGGKDDKNAIALRSGPAWSRWHPAGLKDGPTEIAEHVGREYRLPDGKQLVAVTGGPLEIAGLPITVAIRKSAAQGGDIDLVDDGSGALYRLCGLGPKCAIAEGKASTERHLLLRREALELALYSFRYLGVAEVAVFLPPKKGQSPTQAVFFRRSETDLATAVARPLDATLVNKTPSVTGVTRSPDAALVNTITTTKLFTFSFTQANQDARAFLVLDPLP